MIRDVLFAGSRRAHRKKSTAVWGRASQTAVGGESEPFLTSVMLVTHIHTHPAGCERQIPRFFPGYFYQKSRNSRRRALLWGVKAFDLANGSVMKRVYSPARVRSPSL